MSGPIQVIVAGVSLPEPGADPALAAAGQLASWTGAALHLVHTFSVPPALLPPDLGGYVPPEWALRFEEDQRALLEQAARATPGAEGAVCHCVAGAPGSAILETAARVGADLLVVGAARMGRLAGAFLGTTAQRVLRGAGVPVLVARRPLHRPVERVLLTTDLSALSAAVHEQGLDTATALFGPPHGVRSLLVVSVPLVPYPLPPDALDRTARAELERFLRARRAGGGAVEAVVRMGNPAEEIAEEARDAGLLVVGTHARGWAARLALGSVAEAAVRDAPCNVLAVPPRPRAPESHAEHGAAGAGEPVPAGLPDEPVPT